jgi:hypothetical protein
VTADAVAEVEEFPKKKDVEEVVEELLDILVVVILADLVNDVALGVAVVLVELELDVVEVLEVDVVTGVDVELVDVMEGVTTQEQADEIRDGFPAQWSTYDGKPVVAVFVD